jgi:hypothetical protein
MVPKESRALRPLFGAELHGNDDGIELLPELGVEAANSGKKVAQRGDDGMIFPMLLWRRPAEPRLQRESGKQKMLPTGAWRGLWRQAIAWRSTPSNPHHPRRACGGSLHMAGRAHPVAA